MKSIATFQSAAERLAEDERLALLCDPLSVLLIGMAEQTSPVIERLLPAWPAPIEVCQAATFTPDSDVRTLILQNADDLSSDRQAALLAWMNDAAGGKHVITTVRGPLYPLVESGHFSAALYYRLNTITFDFGEMWRQWLLADDEGWPAGGGTT